jgi:hypothetical protein
LKKNRSIELWLTIAILGVTTISSAFAYKFWYNLNFFVGAYFFVHWFSIIATTFISISIPIHYLLKYEKPQKVKLILRIHVFGNLIAFLPLSLHFAQNVGRLTEAPERLGDGFVLYLILAFIVLTGIIERFRKKEKPQKLVKIAHGYSVILFYFAVLIHVLGFNF